MAIEFDTAELIRKIKNNETLTDQEEAYYIEHVIKFTREEIPVETIMAISDNKNTNLLID